MRNKVTLEQVEAWLGSDATRSDMLELLTEIANGFYPAEQFKKDVELYIDNE
jgi:hypothetical protein